ncbi:hypothetical protein GCM10012276_22990 [Nocardioides deserti]|nr:hypothetical protein GCM10012276_22990 [Nocardioides deserti]
MCSRTWPTWLAPAPEKRSIRSSSRLRGSEQSADDRVKDDHGVPDAERPQARCGVPYSLAMTTAAAPLEVSARRRAVRWAVVGALVLALAVVVAWYSAHPPALATSVDTRHASTPVDTPVYVGMYAAPSDRTLSVDGVKVHATANTEVQVAPLLCKGGSLVVTSDPEAFCRELVTPAGERLEPGDSVVVEVKADVPAVVVLDRVRIGYQDGIRAATQQAGVENAIVTVLGR